MFRSQAGAGSAVDDPGGGIDDPGGGDTDDLGSLDNLATSTTTSSKTSVSFVSSSLTTGFSLLSLSDKSAVDVVGDLDVGDCATGSFCSSQRATRQPPRMSWWARIAWAPVVKFGQAGTIVVSAESTAVASRGRWVSTGASGT